MGKKKCNVYEVDLYKITFGQAEDIIDAIDLDAIEFKNIDELAEGIKKTLNNRLPKICPIITSMFDISSKELATVKIDELVNVITSIIAYALNELSKCASNSNKKKGGNDASLYQILFDLQITLCEKFSGLTPFVLRRETMQEVFLLMKRFDSAQMQQKEPIHQSNNDVIRRPATDDWF